MFWDICKYMTGFLECSDIFVNIWYNKGVVKSCDHVYIFLFRKKYISHDITTVVVSSNLD
jgi:hypothetical protein